MAEREHFTNGRTWTFGTGFGLVGLSFSAQVSSWAHWITIGTGYGSGGVLMLLAAVWITKSYYSREKTVEVGSSMLWNGLSSKEDLEAAERQTRERSLGQSAESQLSVLQMETIEIATKLQRLSERFGPRPLYDPAYAHGAEPNIEESLRDFYARVGPWETKWYSAYALEFHGRIVNFVHGFGSDGIADPRLNVLLASEMDADKAREVSERLICLALKPINVNVIPGTNC